MFFKFFFVIFFIFSKFGFLRFFFNSNVNFTASPRRWYGFNKSVELPTKNKQKNGTNRSTHPQIVELGTLTHTPIMQCDAIRWEQFEN